MKRKSLERQVAEIVDSTPYVCTPGMYGLSTEAEMLKHTMVGAARAVAEEKARKIIKLVRR